MNTNKKKTTVLMIMDGFGLRDNKENNAVAMARTPNLDRLMSEYPFVKGNASGLYVGLPEGQMGNSEVGHLNMGAGRIVYQDLTLITKEIEDGSFFKNEALLQACRNAKEKGTAIHFMGLLSDGGVHSHETHLYALLRLAKEQGLEKVYVHCFLDGRDTPPTSGAGYIRKLQAKMEEIGVGKIGTVSGRYYAMDRDKRWERVRKAYEALTLGVGQLGEDAVELVEASYEAGTTDEFVVPSVITDADGEPLPRISDGDSVVFFNFRPDRAREISRALLDDDFAGFEREKIKDLVYVCFTEYDPTIEHTLVAYPPETMKNTLGEYVSSLGLKQLRLAETEKYAHVTFFFNGGVEKPNPGEDRILVPSPRVATYDLQPEMSAPEVCEKLLAAIRGGEYDLIIINFANPDMVGHTGSLPAAIQACETVDTCVGKTVEVIKETGSQMFLLADHGNAELMVDEKTGEPFTAHTNNPVPFILINADPSYGLAEGGALCDVAPTLLDLMGLPQPPEMTGHSLLIKK